MPTALDLGPEYVQGLPLVSRGKVRDTYLLEHHPHYAADDLLLVVASDRISIFDFVLNATVPRKGEVLTAMNVFWKLKLGFFRNDLLAYGRRIDKFLPEHLLNNPELQKRAVVVRRLEMLPVECIVRGYLTGSGWQAYKQTSPHMVCGHILPDGLSDGSELSPPLFTPTTKAEVGHDEPITAQSVRDAYSHEPEEASLSLYESARRLALEKGLIIADTKFEFGLRQCILTLADEALTPDSSRFWDVAAWQVARKSDKSPVPWDKQHVRNYGERLGIKKRDPTNPEDYAWVRDQVISPEVLEQTSQIYLDVFKRLTSFSLKEYQRKFMKINA